MDLIKVVEDSFKVEKSFPEFKSGDTITVAYKIKEGNKERIQLFKGDVISITGHAGKKHKQQECFVHYKMNQTCLRHGRMANLWLFRAWKIPNFL